MLLSRLRGPVSRYFHHPDPLVRTANMIALVVVFNQPFYPLYLYWFVSPNFEAAYWTFLSTPFFLAVPMVSRMDAMAGRALLPVAGIGNTMLSAKAFGDASGVELFLLPIVLIAFVVFRPKERLHSFALAGLSLAVYMVMHGGYGEPFHRFTAEEYASFIRLNATSVGMLTALVGILASNLIAERGGDPK
ncbi:hypothetical protein ICI42_04135 [Tianweitania sp. Rool2]|uniref:Uncharacterized protein n=1 Tax=Oryzicola mucosus TaxID=2767425 RepID=A0A8J6PEZ9_9HYPH|nr:hypothetical protein [Oryzicola mucosus]